MARLQQIAVPLLRLQPEWQPSLQFVRFRKRINIQRPFHPHFERDKVLHVCKPFFAKPREPTSLIESCQKQVELNKKKESVENPYEQLVAKDVLNWFNHSNMIAFLHANPIAQEDNYKAKIGLQRQNMTLKTQYGRKTIKMALDNTQYEPVLRIIESRTALIFSVEQQVGKLLKILKKFPQFILIAGIVDNRFLSKNELVRYSELSDLQTTRAQLVTTLNLAASQLVQHLTHHQTILVGHLKQHIEQQQKELETDPRHS